MRRDTPLAIEVVTQFVPEQSEPARQRYLFYYSITMVNRTADTLVLQRRYWLITDGNGERMEVDGEGVVGETPTLNPGQKFQYTSSVVLPTPLGTMEGHYILDGPGGNIKAPVDRFRLHVPGAVH